MEKYQFYDNLIAATYTNLAIEALHNENLYFNSFNINSYIHKTFLQIAFIVSGFEEAKIYLNCKFFDFLKILFHNYTIKEIIQKKCVLRFSRRPHSPSTDIDFIAAFEVKEFQTDIGVFEEIWKEYYEK